MVVLLSCSSSNVSPWLNCNNFTMAESCCQHVVALQCEKRKYFSTLSEKWKNIDKQKMWIYNEKNM